MFKKVLYYFNLFLIFIILLACAFIPTIAHAQNYGQLSGYPYDVQRFYYSRSDGRWYGDMRSFINRDNLPYSRADAAWERQWAPIRDITGISTGTARRFLADFQVYFKSEMQKVYANAEDWGIILGTSELLDSFGEVSSDLFAVLTDQTAEWVLGYDGPALYQYVPEDFGHGNYYYPPEGLNYPHAFAP